ncbi:MULTISPECIES: DegT/DnrJ/EryC1/StrS family aminotransferase [unclassified Methylobacter]|jgi:dTDP-4-amino-4,6-dideoxygalactose transaminase|uniref:DegT/DnrJ/EryC1/StrS family aminotransferase n=1 Tax=unclassified Methylobacter TaxID=2635283 RepID=UPI00189362F6|nr:DegT/DnrJ/EryC1/StrS family aminotransferase [Methylobacter sp. BlB1]MBF6650753.1 aminotransferase class I/II-fold pyridoxal phosphate-dependent enzyme [Methylobacter sp. BlB1]
MKHFESRSDLALFGAPPAFPEPLHVGRPNMGSQETFLSYMNDIFNRRWLSNNGPLVQEFERLLAEFLGVKHCVAMCNGTVALEIAIRALELKGEVIMPSYTFVATAHALQWQEITPVFADIDPNTHNLDPEAVLRMITPKTTGIIGVHLWGRSCPVDDLQAIANDYGLKLMFDAAHAFGCSYKGEMIGGFGECEVLSFHATKFFNTFEGGAVVTSNDDLARKMRLMKNFGFSGYDNVIYPGTNGKMTEIAAAMGLVNLDAIGEFVEANRRNHERYSMQLNEIQGVSVLAYDDREHNNYQYVVVEVSDELPVSRDEIIHALHAENVLARRYFWPGCHNMQPYKAFYPNAGVMLPNTKTVADRVIVLPTGITLPESAIDVVASVMRLLTSQ